MEQSPQETRWPLQASGAPNEDGDCVIHCFGSLGQTGVNNDDVRYICGFYSLPYREDWRREEARDAGDSFYILIKTDD